MAPTPPEKKLRSYSKVYILGHCEHQIVGSKLPSNRQVLSVFLFNMREVKLPQKASAQLVIEEATIFWEKARIPISVKWYCIKKLDDLYETYRSLQKSSTKPSEIQIQKEQEFIDSLDDLFDIAAVDALKSMKNEVDKEFLLAQRKEGREGSLIGIEKKGTKKEERKQKGQ